MARKVEDFRPLVRAAIAAARAAGLGDLADPVEKAALAACTTSSELLGETGRAIVSFLHAGGRRVPPDVAAKLRDCLQHVQATWPDIREAPAAPSIGP